jgi:hypothetical protein
MSRAHDALPPAVRGGDAKVNIGQPKRIIQVEPVSVPLPEFVPEPAPAEPVREPAREPEPAEHPS